MGRPSLNNQFNELFMNRYTGEGFDKHSAKKSGEDTTDLIKSYSELKGFKDFSINFKNFLMKETDIRMIKDINNEACQRFLDKKAEEGCTKGTVNLYKERLESIEKFINNYDGNRFKFKKQANFGELFVPETKIDKRSDRGSGSIMPREVLEACIKYGENTGRNSQSVEVIKLQEKIGVRVEELVSIKSNHIKVLENGKTEIFLANCKGGKDQTKTVNTVDIKFLLDLKENKKDNEKIFTIQSDSVNAWLRTTQTKLGFKEQYGRTFSNHDIRRLIINEKFSSLITEGYTKSEAIAICSKELNHITPRDEMIKKSYIKID